MKTWLIQRGKFENREFKQGIDSILSFDYMGSSEFEWGALPKSLGKIRNELNNYTYLDITLKDKLITVFCKDSQINDIELYLSELSDNKMHLKEFSAFDSYVNSDGYFKDKFDFWWDIQNHIMFWKKNINFETKFKTLINNETRIKV
jgi:hypothetical protein